MIRLATAVLAVSLLAGPVAAAEFNEKINIGDAAPAWADLPGTDGKKHSLADLKDKDVVVVVFTCNSCPVAEGYEDRLIAFAKKHCEGDKSKVALVAINVNTIEEDRLAKMKDKATEKGFNFPYLYDESQKIAHDFGAMYTPEFFVLNKERKVVYMGLMDDRTDAKLVKENYVEAAVAAALKGEKPAKTETQARGCKIRFVKKK